MAETGKRKSLGRGLSSLLGEAAAGVAVATGREAPSAPADEPSTGLKVLPVEYLRPGAYQPRHNMDEHEIENLAQSIEEKGILQPILVRKLASGANDYEIIAGERRWRAAQRAQLHEVPVLVRELSDRETLEIALIENLQRENLSPLEEALGFKRLMDEFTHSQEELAGAVGKSRSHVANMMRLLNLPDAVKAMVDDGRLSAGHARALLNAPDSAVLAEVVVKKGLNVRQADQLVRDAAGGAGKKAKKAKPPKDPDTLSLERDLSNMLGLKVEIGFKGGKGSLTVHYGSLDQLDDILHRLSHGEHGSPAINPDAD